MSGLGTWVGSAVTSAMAGEVMWGGGLGTWVPGRRSHGGSGGTGQGVGTSVQGGEVMWGVWRWAWG